MSQGTLGTTATLPQRLCVDASLVLHIVLPDEYDAATDALWSNWLRQGLEIVSPVLLYAEVTSVIRLRVANGDSLKTRATLYFRSSIALVSRGLTEMIFTCALGNWRNAINCDARTT